MPLCKTCDYVPWDTSNPVTEEAFIEALGTVGVSPLGKGPERVAVGSPFKAPLPDVIRLCCLDKQMCEKQGVPFSGLDKLDEVNVEINKARSAIYKEAGLPAIG
jgi:hypothetical protein